MTKKTFAVIYNLEGLSEAELEAYKRAAAIYFDLDPDTNAFDIVWMTDPDTGFKRRQLYARRGTTDILRDKRGISVTSMVQHDGPGYVSFAATGVNAAGRQEIAVGAHSIEGLTGEKLAAAVSTAETRAGRRMTLKFVGLGILDYTEVSDPADIKANAPNLELVNPVVKPPIPVFAPSAATTAAIPPPAPTALAAKDTVAQGLAEAEEVARKAREEFRKQQQEMLDEARKHLAAIPPSISPVQIEMPHGTIDNKGVITPQEVAPEVAKKPRAPRRKKNTVEIGTPEQVSARPATAQTEEDTVGTGNAGQTPASHPPQAEPTQVNPAAPPQVVAANLVPPQPAPVADFPGKPTKEQEEGYRNVLREYANNILPIGGGMKPSPGIGGPAAKLRAFAETYVGKPTQTMTAADWDAFLLFLVEFGQRNGEKGLVKYINDTIEAK